jgi:hypothetical protein
MLQTEGLQQAVVDGLQIDLIRVFSSSCTGGPSGTGGT